MVEDSEIRKYSMFGNLVADLWEKTIVGGTILAFFLMVNNLLKTDAGFDARLKIQCRNQ